MPKLEAYSRKLSYSYALGVFPSLMLMEAQPQRIQRLLLSLKAGSSRNNATIRRIYLV